MIRLAVTLMVALATALFRSRLESARSVNRVAEPQKTIYQLAVRCCRAR